MVDELIVGVLRNSTKIPLFSVEERVSMLEEIMVEFPNVKVDSFEGLLVDYARQNNINFIIRGLRAVTDFDYELQIAQTNRVVNPDVDTVFFTTNLEYAYLSSTIVREVASYGGDISRFVPSRIVNNIYEKFNSSRDKECNKNDK